MPTERKVILYIAMSLDGFIAGKNDEIDWLDSIDHGKNDYGYSEFTSNVDTYIVGKRTYDVVLELTEGVFQQAEQYDCYVITRTPKEPENGVTFYSSDIKDLIDQLKSRPGNNIYCDGGGKVASMLLEHNLIDEFIITVFPKLLGDGIRLFPGANMNTITLETVNSEKFDNGIVQLHYRKSV